MSAAILFGSMAVMIGFGIPIAIVLGVSSALTLIFSGAPLGVIPSMMQATVQKFSLLTIPLFVLAGAIMDKGGISKRLINLADSIIGPVHGGLGYVAVVAALFFAAISGSGTATVAAMGSILIPAMVAQGYDAVRTVRPKHRMTIPIRIPKFILTVFFIVCPNLFFMAALSL